MLSLEKEWWFENNKGNRAQGEFYVMQYRADETINSETLTVT